MIIPVGSKYVHQSARYYSPTRHFIQMRFEGDEQAPINVINDVMQLNSFTSIAVYHPTLSLYGVDLVFGEEEDLVWAQLKYAENIIQVFTHERM